MTNAATPGIQSPPRPRMTLRVYTVTAAGAVKEDRGTVSVPYGGDLPPMMSVNPPCKCSRCRAGQAVVR